MSHHVAINDSSISTVNSMRIKNVWVLIHLLYGISIFKAHDVQFTHFLNRHIRHSWWRSRFIRSNSFCILFCLFKFRGSSGCKAGVTTTSCVAALLSLRSCFDIRHFTLKLNLLNFRLLRCLLLRIQILSHAFKGEVSDWDIYNGSLSSICCFILYYLLLRVTHSLLFGT